MSRGNDAGLTRVCSSKKASLFQGYSFPMFKRMQGMRVMCDEGFSVAVISGGCDGLAVSYQEQGKEILLPAFLQRATSNDQSLLPDAPILIEVPHQLKWLEPNEACEIANSDKERILVNIERALNFMQEPFTFIRA